MRKCTLMLMVMFMGIALTSSVFAADREAIKNQVDEIVQAIDSGKSYGDFKDAAKKEPNYVYIMKEDGELLVHPSLEGKNLKEAALPAYEAVSQATVDGTWVQYEWKGSEKNAYVRKTGEGIIVGSGY